MASDGILTDDVVAARLIEDANKHALRFSSFGMDANSSSRPEHKPKPNTRFLRNIIKTTENHNAALLAKEAAESQARLQELRDAEDKERRRRRPEPQDIRRRQMGDISAILRGRNDVVSGSGRLPRESDKSERRKRDKGEKEERGHKRERSRERERDKKKSSSSRRRDSEVDDRDERNHKSRRSRHEERRSSRSRREDKETRHGRDRSRHRHRSSSPDNRDRRRHHRDRSKRRRTDDDDVQKDDLIKPFRRTGRPEQGRLRRPDSFERRDNSTDREDEPHKSDASSDPLEDLIGPRPSSTSAPAARGRGSTARLSGIDARFETSYDPSSDVRPPDDTTNGGGGGGDWEEAVEVFRDRQRWKAQGAARLRDAGFTDEQVRKWEASDRVPPGAESGNLEDVRWSKKGELRQWDLGKTVNSDGSISTGPDWAK